MVLGQAQDDFQRLTMALRWPRWLMENASAYCADACAEEDNINLYIYYIVHIIRHVCTYSPVPIRTFIVQTSSYSLLRQSSCLITCPFTSSKNKESRTIKSASLCVTQIFGMKKHDRVFSFLFFCFLFHFILKTSNTVRGGNTTTNDASPTSKHRFCL